MIRSVVYPSLFIKRRIAPVRQRQSEDNSCAVIWKAPSPINVTGRRAGSASAAPSVAGKA
jgi:hypothetical protein